MPFTTAAADTRIPSSCEQTSSLFLATVEASSRPQCHQLCVFPASCGALNAEFPQALHFFFLLSLLLNCSYTSISFGDTAGCRSLRPSLTASLRRLDTFLKKYKVLRQKE